MVVFNTCIHLCFYYKFTSDPIQISSNECNCQANGFIQNHDEGLIFEEYLTVMFRYILRNTIRVMNYKDVSAYMYKIFTEIGDGG